MKILMNKIAIGTAVGTIICIALYQMLKWDILFTLSITLGTTCYHFVMRLVIGYAVVKLRKQPWDYNSKWLGEKSFEKGLYRKLKVKSWKGKMPTYNPESFSMQNHTVKEIVQTMCGSEIVHECIIIFSFLPLFMAIPFGVFPVFFITSVFGACVDLTFVIMQRYNRPRLVRVLEREELKHGTMWEEK